MLNQIRPKKSIESFNFKRNKIIICFNYLLTLALTGFVGLLSLFLPLTVVIK